MGALSVLSSMCYMSDALFSAVVYDLPRLIPWKCIFIGYVVV
jgi:hypothetical protein